MFSYEQERLFPFVATDTVVCFNKKKPAADGSAAGLRILGRD